MGKTRQIEDAHASEPTRELDGEVQEQRPSCAAVKAEPRAHGTEYLQVKPSSDF